MYNKIPKTIILVCILLCFCSCDSLNPFSSKQARFAVQNQGDINLNGTAYEVADAELLAYYFIYGESVFTIDKTKQIIASDCNADGNQLTVADLTYAVRNTVGDALPFLLLPKVISANLIYDEGIFSTDEDMGGAFIVVKGNRNPTLLAENMDMMFNFDGINTRILVYSLEGRSFLGDFLKVNGEIISFELASVGGSMVTQKFVVPTFKLEQNYPNPFATTTTISFSIPADTSLITIEVTNTTGQLVFSHSKFYEAGVHSVVFDGTNFSSGRYLCTMKAKDFEDSIVMWLLH